MHVLARVPIARLTYAPRAWFPVAAWSALAIVAAFFERQSASGADHVLLGSFGSIVVPFLAFATVSSVLANEGLSEAIRPIVSLGASPARVAFATVLTAMLVSAAATGLLSTLVVVIAGSPHLGSDLAASLWISALAGACYAAWFSLGSTFGRRGTGRATFLVIDYLFGATTGATSSTIALFTPRGNLHSLLGGTAPNEISQRVSSVALVLLAAVCLVLASRRVKG